MKKDDKEPKNAKPYEEQQPSTMTTVKEQEKINENKRRTTNQKMPYEGQQATTTTTSK